MNLAYQVEDGQKIYIPYVLDMEENADDGEVVSNNAGENVLSEDEDEKSGGTININTATAEKLQELPGIRNIYCRKDSSL